ncbi:hypothetical protein PtB15_4B377 [Puccinia triticina]|nr:hypothetical protein PtB15_4B377 [Puccinia triticina]
MANKPAQSDGLSFLSMPAEERYLIIHILYRLWVKNAIYSDGPPSRARTGESKWHHEAISSDNEEAAAIPPCEVPFIYTLLRQFKRGILKAIAATRPDLPLSQVLETAESGGNLQWRAYSDEEYRRFARLVSDSVPPEKWWLRLFMAHPTIHFGDPDDWTWKAQAGSLATFTELIPNGEPLPPRDKCFVLGEGSNAPSSTPDEEDYHDEDGPSFHSSSAQPSEDDEAYPSSHSSPARHSENYDSDESAINTPTNKAADAPIQATTKKAVEPPIQAPTDLIKTGLIFEAISVNELASRPGDSTSNTTEDDRSPPPPAQGIARQLVLPNVVTLDGPPSSWDSNSAHQTPLIAPPIVLLDGPPSSRESPVPAEHPVFPDVVLLDGPPSSWDSNSTLRKRAQTPNYPPPPTPRPRLSK